MPSVFTRRQRRGVLPPTSIQQQGFPAAGFQTPLPVWNVVRKLASQAVTSNAVLFNDAELFFPMLASTTYQIRLSVALQSTTTPDFKWAISGPASPTRRHQFLQWSPASSGAITSAILTNSNGFDMDFAGGTDDGHLLNQIVWENGTTAGTFYFQWAQNTSDASATTVLKGSYLEWAVVE